MSFQVFCRDLLAKNPRLDGTFRRLIWSRIHFSEAEQKFLDALPAGSIDVAVDVGAALAPYSWILSRKARKVFAFEPGEVHARYLHANVPGTNVTLIEAAVGNEEKTVSLFTAGTDTNANHTATVSTANPVSNQPGVTTRTVPQVVLDHYFGEHLAASERIDVVKIDVEGYEGAVLDGAKALIGHHLPLVICEIESRHNPDYLDVFTLLRGMGYRCYYYREGAYHAFDGDSLADLQKPEALEDRLAGHLAGAGGYVNNFIFQHPDTRIKLHR